MQENGAETMKKKLNIQLIGIAILSMLLTMGLILFVYYDLFQQQVLDELKTVTRMMGSIENLTVYSVKDYQTEFDNLRISLLDENGNVIYDSDVNAADLDNHAQRPEISEAYEKGEGYAIRKSDTLSQNNFYYAILLDNGGVLRVSKEARSIFSVFASSVPSLIWKKTTTMPWWDWEMRNESKTISGMPSSTTPSA